MGRLTALVTGATGFIGTNLVKRLLQLDWNVYTLIRKSSYKSSWRLDSINGAKKLFLEDIIDVQPKIRFDICFHLAAYGVDYREQDVNEMIAGNVDIVLNILRYCIYCGVKKFIHTGSCFEYGDYGNRKLKETDRLKPNSLYGAAKAASVLMANSYAKQLGINLVTLRPFGVYGEYEGMYRLVPQLVKAIITKQPVELTAGEQVRDYLYVQDLVNAYIYAAQMNLEPYEIYNVCSGRAITIKEIVNRLCQITGCERDLFKFGAKPYRKDEVMYIVGDNTKFKSATGWHEDFDIDRGLLNTYEWYKQFLGEAL